MVKGENTRSGMLWEVERILKECYSLGTLPKILLLENVTQLHSKENMPHLQAWLRELEKLGYSSYWQDMNSADYGVPQHRDRTFVVSILGDYYYEFPKKFPLKLVLADMLEDEVDEKYYLSDQMIKYISEKGTGGFANADCRINLEVARPITTDPNKRAGTTNYLCNDLPSGFDLNSLCIKIPEATKKGYSEAYEGLRIRKLTPREAGRLMGVRDSDIDKMSKNQSNASLYHLFGDSIVVDVLMNIFKKLL